jgi:hypothetical protein
MPAFVSAFGTEVNNPIGVFDDIQMMLNHQNRVAAVNQFIQNAQQFFNVVKVKPDRRLVKDV